MPRPKPDEHTGERTLRLALRLSPDEMALVQAAAEADGATYRDSWARETLLRTAGRLLKQQKRSGSNKSTG